MKIWDRFMVEEVFSAFTQRQVDAPIRDGFRALVFDGARICLDSVAEFHFTTQRYFKGSGNEILANSPNVAPPWPISVCRWRDRYEGEAKALRDSMFVVKSVPYGTALPAVIYDHDEKGVTGALAATVGKGVNPAHLCRGSYFVVDGNPERVCHVGDFYWCVSYSGVLYLDSTTSIVPGFLGDTNIVRKVLLPYFLGVSLSHCKNVDVQLVKPDKRLSCAQEKRYGVPKFSYGVLEISPMQKILRAEGGLDEHGSLSKALHICRGHFKDYRARGLFGRNKGLYWWDMHTRGDAAQGVAVRDYTVSL